jgi:hypothetical protein
MKVEKEIMAADLSSGVARVIMTPPIGILMTGFAGRGPAGGIQDDLTATALVLEGPAADLSGEAQGTGVSRLAMTAGDLLSLRPEEVRDRLRANPRGLCGRWLRGNPCVPDGAGSR